MGKKSLKICVVIGSLDVGGTETHLARVLPDLLSSQLEISVYCISRPGFYAESLKKAGINIIYVPWLGTLARRFFIFKPLLLLLAPLFFTMHIFVQKFDIIHFFLPASYILLGPLSLIHKRSKKVMSRRSLNLYQKQYPAIVRSIECWLHTRMDFVTGNSHAIIKQLIHDENIPESKLSLIYNGINIPNIPQEARKRIRDSFNIPHDCIIMTIVANLIPYKGHKDLLKACSMLQSDNWRLLIVGQDSAHIQKELEDLANRYQINRQVLFVGQRHDVAEVLAASDIGLLTSHQEGFSNSVLEGMAASLPMIVTDVGGNSEAITDGVTGFVIPVKSPRAICDAMKMLLDDPEKRANMGHQAQLRARSHFSHDGCVRQYINLYGQLFEK